MVQNGTTTVNATIDRTYPIDICLPVGYEANGDGLYWAFFPDTCVPIASGETTGTATVTWNNHSPANDYRIGIFWPRWMESTSAQQSPPIDSEAISVQLGIASIGLPSSIRPGQTDDARVFLTSDADVDTTVVLTIGDPSIATVVTEVVVPGGSSSAPFTVSGLVDGTTTLRADLGIATRTVNLLVRPFRVSSLTVSSGVYAGYPSDGRVVLDHDVYVDTVVTLTSSNPAVASVPASVTITAGHSVARFDIPTSAWPGGTTTISATIGTSTRSRTLVVKPYLLTALSLPTSVAADSGGTGTVSVDRTVAVDTVVTLSSGAPSVATGPASVTIPAGRTSATFRFTTSPGAGGTATFTATLGASSKTETIRVVPIGVASISLFSSVYAGSALTGTIYLNAGVPVDTEVTLASSDPDTASVPATVVVPAGSSSVGFTVTTPAGPGGTVTITATLGASSRTDTLVVSFYQINGLFGLNSGGYAGYDLNVTLYLTENVETDTVVTITSSDPDIAAPPATVTVPAGFYYVAFTIPTSAGAGGTVTIRADLFGSSDAVTLTIYPQTVGTLSIPSSVYAGYDASATVYLDTSVAVDTVVTLTSSDPDIAAVPESVTIPAGLYYAPFTVTTSAGAGGTVDIIATLGASSRTAALAVIPYTVSSISMSSSVYGGYDVDATVYLDASVPVDTEVTLTSSNPADVAVPATVTVPAGLSYASFTVDTAPQASGSVTITATVGPSSATAELAVIPYTVTGISMSSSVYAGYDVDATLYLDASVAVDTIVTLVSSDPSIAGVPPEVTVPAGLSYASFTVTTSPGVGGVVSITATVAASTGSASLTVNPYAITSLSMSSSVEEGSSLSATVYLDASVAQDTVVTLTSSDPSVASLPGSVTVPAGLTYASFEITGVAEGSADITATLGASSVASTVVVSPVTPVAQARRSGLLAGIPSRWAGYGWTADRRGWATGAAG